MLLLWCFSNRSHVLPRFGFLCCHHPIAHATKLEREPLLQQSKSKGLICREKREASLLQQIKGFNLRRERETDILAAANQKVQSAVRETIVAAAKSNGSICRGRETDILPEANPKGSICRGRNTHTHTHTLTFLLQQSEAFNLQTEREILACCCSISKLQSAGTNTP